MSTLLTLDLLRKTAPTNMKKMITQEMVDTINNLQEDEQFREYYRDGIIGYSHVLQDGRFKVTDYMNAVKFISYLNMGNPIIKAYAKTFPDRYMHYVSKGTEPKHIQSVASLYNKGKLVNLVREQSAIPFHVFNQDIRQKALMTQVELMQTARSEKVRSDAANSVLTHTKAPENVKVEMDIGIKDDKGAIHELRLATQELVRMQKERLIDGSMSVEQVAHSKLIQEQDIVDAEFTEE